MKLYASPSSRRTPRRQGTAARRSARDLVSISSHYSHPLLHLVACIHRDDAYAAATTSQDNYSTRANPTRLKIYNRAHTLLCIDRNTRPYPEDLLHTFLSRYPLAVLRSRLLDSSTAPIQAHAALLQGFRNSTHIRRAVIASILPPNTARLHLLPPIAAPRDNGSKSSRFRREAAGTQFFVPPPPTALSLRATQSHAPKTGSKKQHEKQQHQLQQRASRHIPGTAKPDAAIASPVTDRKS